MTRIAHLLTAVWLAACATTEPPQSDDRERARLALSRLFAGGEIRTADFTPVFLTQVPARRLARIRDQLLRDNGKLRVVAPTPDSARWLVRLERAEVPALVGLDAEGRVTSLWLEQAILDTPDLPAALARLGELPGDVAWLVSVDGKELAARDAERPLAVGSAFKMLVLERLGAAIAEGRLRWDQVVALSALWRAPGSSRLVNWPVGAAVTIETLAMQMIAESDNTATDALMSLIGRNAIDAAAPPRLRPLPTTREMLGLRGYGSDAAVAAWRSGDVATRRRVLAEAGVNLAAESGARERLQVDYFLSARELAGLIVRVSDMGAMQINQAAARGLGYERVAYKGGSTSTSVNMTYHLLKNGRRIVVVATWNDEAGVNVERFNAELRAVLAVLARSPAAS